MRSDSPAPISSAPGHWIKDALSTAGSPRARKVARAITLAAAAWEVGRKAHGKITERVLYTVGVPGTDDVYDALHAWLVENVPSRKRRALTALTGRLRSGSDELMALDVETASSVPTSLVVRQVYDGSRPQTVSIDGHRVQVKIDRDTRLPDGVTVSLSERSWFRPLERIVFTCYGVKARDSVLAFIGGLAIKTAGPKPRPRMFVARRWGDWSRISDAPPRPLETVILRAGQRERIVVDLERFLASESLYGKVGLPWHRGLLLHGVPGTGKTSLAKALADHFGLDLYLLPLSDMETDTNLLALLGAVGGRSMLVIEDIDVVHAAKARDDAESKGISMSGLLNALDGLATPHGLVTVMTTNRLETLDPALVRPGRADLVEELAPLDDEQVIRLARLVVDYPRWDDFLGEMPALAGAVLTHAELLEAAKPHLEWPHSAWNAMRERVHRAGVSQPSRNGAHR